MTSHYLKVIEAFATTYDRFIKNDYVLSVDFYLGLRGFFV